MILVTGATGFIGGHLVEALDAGGYRFRCLVRRRGVQLPGEVVVGDLAEAKDLSAALGGVEMIIHLAGVTRAVRAADYYRGNTHATETLARAAAAANVRLVHVSSLAAAGPNPGAAPLDEDAAPQPISHYGKSKLEAENIVRGLLPAAVILRPPVVYGPRDTGVLQVLKPLSRGVALEIAGGERWVSFIYVKDLVEGILAAALHPGAAGRTYYLSHPKPVSWSELAATAAQIMGRRLRVWKVPSAAAYAVGWWAEWRGLLSGKPAVLSREKIRDARCAHWTCDPRRAALELQFRARTALPEGLAETLAWYKEAGWLLY